MQKQIADRIIFLCDVLPDKFRQIPAADFQTWPQPTKWSQQEILGHLIDSAANNHQRFVRGQIEDTPTVFYQQDQWVNIQAYQQENKDILISLWESYNRHLAHVITQVANENLEKECRGKDGSTVTLAFLIEDYLRHLEHHLHQIIVY
ncbi:DinB family protein [Adhaeribacter arboris]|uniref:DinB family protein n=1 Tax=Adhaeribacter arboris TaxID=2072846 RepID=A0A2T2YHR2_9BACT|nr:DinB family protein [Adhaeribacter arboris]PSR55040.1 DinB family protein [Adhaeribacter arboris]